MKKYLIWLITLAWAGLILYLTTIPNFAPSSDSLVSWLLSNGGHFFFFGVLAALLTLSMRPSYSLILTSIYGLFIEFLQLNIPGRSFDLRDWALDTFGVIAFLLILKKLQSKS